MGRKAGLAKFRAQGRMAAPGPAHSYECGQEARGVSPRLWDGGGGPPRGPIRVCGPSALCVGPFALLARLMHLIRLAIRLSLIVWD